MSDSTVCCRATGEYCHHCDLLGDLPGLHIVKVDRHRCGLRIVVESVRTPVMGVSRLWGARAGAWADAGRAG